MKCKIFFSFFAILFLSYSQKLSCSNENVWCVDDFVSLCEAHKNATEYDKGSLAYILVMENITNTGFCEGVLSAFGIENDALVIRIQPHPSISSNVHLHFPNGLSLEHHNGIVVERFVITVNENLYFDVRNNYNTEIRDCTFLISRGQMFNDGAMERKYIRFEGNVNQNVLFGNTFIMQNENKDVQDVLVVYSNQGFFVAMENKFFGKAFTHHPFTDYSLQGYTGLFIENSLTYVAQNVFNEGCNVGIKTNGQNFGFAILGNELSGCRVGMEIEEINPQMMSMIGANVMNKLDLTMGGSTGTSNWGYMFAYLKITTVNKVTITQNIIVGVRNVFVVNEQVFESIDGPKYFGAGDVRRELEYPNHLHLLFELNEIQYYFYAIQIDPMEGETYINDYHLVVNISANTFIDHPRIVSKPISIFSKNSQIFVENNVFERASSSENSIMTTPIIHISVVQVTDHYVMFYNPGTTSTRFHIQHNLFKCSTSLNGDTILRYGRYNDNKYKNENVETPIPFHSNRWIEYSQDEALTHFNHQLYDDSMVSRNIFTSECSNARLIDFGQFPTHNLTSNNVKCMHNVYPVVMSKDDGIDGKDVLVCDGSNIVDNSYTIFGTGTKPYPYFASSSNVNYYSYIIDTDVPVSDIVGVERGTEIIAIGPFQDSVVECNSTEISESPWICDPCEEFGVCDEECIMSNPSKCFPCDIYYGFGVCSTECKQQQASLCDENDICNGFDTICVDSSGKPYHFPNLQEAIDYVVFGNVRIANILLNEEEILPHSPDRSNCHKEYIHDSVCHLSIAIESLTNSYGLDMYPITIQPHPNLNGIIPQITLRSFSIYGMDYWHLKDFKMIFPYNRIDLIRAAHAKGLVFENMLFETGQMLDEVALSYGFNQHYSSLFTFHNSSVKIINSKVLAKDNNVNHHVWDPMSPSSWQFIKTIDGYSHIVVDNVPIEGDCSTYALLDGKVHFSLKNTDLSNCTAGVSVYGTNYVGYVHVENCDYHGRFFDDGLSFRKFHFLRTPLCNDDNEGNSEYKTIVLRNNRISGVRNAVIIGPYGELVIIKRRNVKYNAYAEYPIGGSQITIEGNTIIDYNKGVIIEYGYADINPRRSRVTDTLTQDMHFNAILNNYFEGEGSAISLYGDGRSVLVENNVIVVTSSDELLVGGNSAIFVSNANIGMVVKYPKMKFMFNQIYHELCLSGMEDPIFEDFRRVDYKLIIERPRPGSETYDCSIRFAAETPLVEELLFYGNVFASNCPAIVGVSLSLSTGPFSDNEIGSNAKYNIFHEEFEGDIVRNAYFDHQQMIENNVYLEDLSIHGVNTDVNAVKPYPFYKFEKLYNAMTDLPMTPSTDYLGNTRDVNDVGKTSAGPFEENIIDCYNIPDFEAFVCSPNGECMSYDNCSCIEGYGGDKCEYPICYGVLSNDPNVCSTRGNCTSPNNCECIEGYELASNCEFHHCYGVGSIYNDTCTGHGECVSYNNCECDISGFYSGDKCENWKCNGAWNYDEFVCNEQGTCDDHDKCVCKEMHKGYNCQYHSCNDKWNNDPKVCNGHGDCLLGHECVCYNYTQYYGSDCEQAYCHGKTHDNDPNPCNHGYCHAYDKCECEKFYGGKACDVEEFQCFFVDATSPHTCAGHGDCVYVDDCECFPDQPYFGDNCDVNYCHDVMSNDSSVCSHGGECVNEKCICDEYHEGDNCEYLVCDGISTRNMDDPELCHQKGICVQDEYYTTYCECTSAYGGRYCQYNRCNGLNSNDPRVCNTFGECIDGGICTCYNYAPYHYGDNCHISMCNGILSNESTVCSEHGRCKEGECICDAVTTGINCEIPYCNGIPAWEHDTVCNGHGKCVDVDTCQCHERWGDVEVDPHCALPICYNVHSSYENEVCNGNGICNGDTGLCDCNEHEYTGAECDIPLCNDIPQYKLDEVCSGGYGQCVEPNTCICNDDSNRIGFDCETIYYTCNDIAYNTEEPDEMLQLCNGHGQCISHNKCKCMAGYFGDACDVTSCYGLFSNDTNVCNGNGECDNGECICNEFGVGDDCMPFAHACHYPTDNVAHGPYTGAMDKVLFYDDFNSGTYKWSAHYGTYYGISYHERSRECGSMYSDDIAHSNMGIFYYPISYPYNFDFAFTPNMIVDEQTIVELSFFYGNSPIGSLTKCLKFQEGDKFSVLIIDASNDDVLGTVYQAYFIQGVHEYKKIHFGIDRSFYLQFVISNDNVPVQTSFFIEQLSVRKGCFSCHGYEDYNPLVCGGYSSHHTDTIYHAGTCIDYDQCVCNDAEGYIWNIETKTCEATCYGVTNSENACGYKNGKGFCVATDKCECNNDYSGAECERNAFYCHGYAWWDSGNVCSNHGKCIANEVCTCDKGYTGGNCELIVCGDTIYETVNDVCNGNGVCDSEDYRNGCVCNDNWGNSGEYIHRGNCDIHKCNGVLATDAHVCNANGHCKSDTYTCECTEIYSGAYCDVPKCGGHVQNDEFVCNNGKGRCLSNHKCECYDKLKWGGDLCEIPLCNGLDENDPNVCNGGLGICRTISHSCACSNLEQWGGYHCDEPLCYGKGENDDGVCSGHGKCEIEHHVCMCDDGYTGELCNKGVCNGVVEDVSAVCSGYGKCVENNVTRRRDNGKKFVCECDESHGGDDCELIKCFGVSEDSAKVCSGHGKCVQTFIEENVEDVGLVKIEKSMCVCSKFYHGEGCDITESSLVSGNSIAGIAIGIGIFIVILIIIGAFVVLFVWVRVESRKGKESKFFEFEMDDDNNIDIKTGEGEVIEEPKIDATDKEVNIEIDEN